MLIALRWSVYGFKMTLRSSFCLQQEGEQPDSHFRVLSMFAFIYLKKKTTTTAIKKLFLKRLILISPKKGNTEKARPFRRIFWHLLTGTLHP